MSAIEDVHAAIFALLDDDAQLATLLGRSNAIHDRVPVQRRFPFITIADINWTDWSTDTLPGRDLVTTIRIWSRGPNRRELYRISDRVCNVLTSWTGLAGDTHIVLSDRLTAAHDRDQLQRAFRATLRFRQLIEPAHP
jgi:hypothetical protein